MNNRSLLPVATILFITLLSLAVPVMAEKTHVITASATEGGVIIPSGTVLVNQGKSQVFLIEPEEGYRIGDVRVDEISLGPISFYTFQNVREDHSLSVTFLSTTGTLELESRPPGASIFLDGVYLGVTSSSGPVSFDRIAAGTHSLRLVLQGYTDYQTSVQITAGTTTTVPLVILSPIPTTQTTTAPATSQTTVPTTTITTTQTTTAPATSQTTVPTTTITTTQTTTAPATSQTTVPTTTTTTTQTTTAPTTSQTTVPTTTTTTTQTTTAPATSQTTVPTTTPAMTGTALPAVSPTQIQPSSNTTPPVGTATGDGGGEAPPFTPPWTLLVLATGLFATIIMSRDILSSSRDTSVPGTRRLLSLLILAIPGIGQSVALHATIRSPGTGMGLFHDLAIIVIPVSFYLILSSIGLIIGALSSWPFRGMLRVHTVAGVVIVFLSLFSLARGDDPAPFVTVLFLISGLLTVLAARWQEGQSATGESRASAGQDREGIADESDVTRAAPPEGQVMVPRELGERYSGIRFVGLGGLAHVYRAIRRDTGEEVALKIPIRSDETTGKSFLKEIRAWEGLSHPNIVRVNEVNILPIPYIEMEYIGQTLADTPKPMPVRKAARICRDLCRGLAYAHERNVVHRDIKPENIMITGDGVPKISDWGMSKVMGIPGMPTLSGFSLAYAAPEQLAPETFGETDKRTDIYQLGCVLYELLTGRVPFPGTDMAQVTAAILSATPPPPSDINPDARLLDGIVMRCLAKTREERYQDAAELGRDLEHFLSRGSWRDFFDLFEES